MVVVLLQAAKGGGLSGTFGGSNVTAMFGSRRTSDFLSKTTVVLATVFLLSCLLINLYISSDSGIEESVIQRQSDQINIPQQQAPPTDGFMPQTGDEPTTTPQDGANDEGEVDQAPTDGN